MAIAIGMVLVIAYVVAGLAIARAVRRFVVGNPGWIRDLASATVLTLFFAPAFVGGGHGVGVAPAWTALLDSDSNRFIVRAAVQSLAATWVIFFIVGVLVRKVRKHPENK